MADEAKTEEPKLKQKERIEALENSVQKILDILTSQQAAKPPTKQEIEVAKAVSDQAPINPAWESETRNILGEALDHCEVFYPRNGGIQFTIVIKKEHSNAPKDYLLHFKVDRRTKDIGNEGLEGVISWAKLVSANLGRTKN